MNYGHKSKNVYPWKTNIITTEFWIGEGSTPISSTTNVASSWDEDWRANNHGSDSPWNRNGYASGSHASTLNPFYVALPFNDLAFPDKARRWLPDGWYLAARRMASRSPPARTAGLRSRTRAATSASRSGRMSGRYATTTRNTSSARSARSALATTMPVSTSHRPWRNTLASRTKTARRPPWRFVDDEEVRPGAWLKLDEQAVLYRALHQLKNTPLPIQKASEPIDDDDDSNKKKIDASKG